MKLEGKLPQLIAVVVAIAVILLIIRPYLGIIAFSALLAYLLYPVYLRLSKRIPESGAAIILTCIALIVTVVGIYYGITIILNEVAKIFMFISKLPLEALSPTMEAALSKFVSQSINSLSTALYTLPKFALSFFVFFISLFYFLKDGKKISEAIINILPFKDIRKKSIAQKINKQVDAFVHVQLVIGLLQGVIAGVGFYMFGLPYPFIAGIAAGILSVLPVLGPYLLYFPVGILIALQGDIRAGIGILIYGLILASIVDYVIRPYFIGKRAEVHPLIIFIGILGGISLLGVMGIFVGPILLATSVIVLKEVQAGLAKA